MSVNVCFSFTAPGKPRRNREHDELHLQGHLCASLQVNLQSFPYSEQGGRSALIKSAPIKALLLLDGMGSTEPFFILVCLKWFFILSCKCVCILDKLATHGYKLINSAVAKREKIRLLDDETRADCWRTTHKVRNTWLRRHTHLSRDVRKTWPPTRGLWLQSESCFSSSSINTALRSTSISFNIFLYIPERGINPYNFSLLPALCRT